MFGRDALLILSRVMGDERSIYAGYPRLVPLAVFLPVNLLVLVILVVSLIGNDVESRSATALAVALFALPSAYLALRCLFLGVWLTPRRIRCVSWFRTFNYKLEDVRRIDAVNYNGIFTGGRDSYLTAMLYITLVDGRTREVRGSISSPSAMRREVRRLRELIAAASLAGPS